ncbi:MAG: hypothetical protein KAW09_07870, partial [Thermoplasmata archaeon]|nr:hypothetical protein [Thermoplasmata archaeon]
MLYRISRVVVAIAVILVAILAGLETGKAEDQQSDDELTLKVAIQTDPSTLNILAEQDEWAQRVLAPVHDTVIHVDPKTEELLPYILKGTDANGNGVFDVNEYGVFTSVPGRPLEVRGFYDFNGVRFHDGYQATIDDLLFTYHLYALGPDNVALDVLKDKGSLPGSNYTSTRWMHLWEVRAFDPVSDWGLWRDDYTDPNYNNSLRTAVHFVQQRPYASFFRQTLAWKILPAYVWEGAGCLYERDTTSFRCGVHEFPGGNPSSFNFGVAYDRTWGNGVPPVDPNAFDYGLAEAWDPSPELVIGTGPFSLVEWTEGQYVSLERNEEYFVGEPGIHKPFISEMIFQVFKTTQTAVFALKSGDIDFIGWSIPPGFLDDLEQSPNVDIVVSDERTFTYLGFNMRREPFGYSSGDPSQGDIGLNFRRAISHL